MNKIAYNNACEIACMMDTKRLCSNLLESLLRLSSCSNTNDDLFDHVVATRKSVESLVNELKIILCNIEDSFDSK